MHIFEFKLKISCLFTISDACTWQFTALEVLTQPQGPPPPMFRPQKLRPFYPRPSHLTTTFDVWRQNSVWPKAALRPDNEKCTKLQGCSSYLATWVQLVRLRPLQICRPWDKMPFHVSFYVTVWKLQIFFHWDFTWNQIWPFRVSKTAIVNFFTLSKVEFSQKWKFKAFKMAKYAFFEPLK